MRTRYNGRIRFFIFGLSALLFTGCFKGEGLAPFNPPTEIRVDATVPSVLYSNKNQVEMDARRTNTLNGPRKLFFRWTCTEFPAGYPPRIDQPLSVLTTVDSLHIGNYQFRLNVSDSNGHEAFASYVLEVKKDTLNQPPKILPLEDQLLYLPRTSMTLYAINAFTVNPVGRDLTFLWSILQQPAGSRSLIFKDKTSAAAQVEGFEEGHYQFSVVVSNEIGLSVADTMSVTVLKDTLSGTTKIYEDLLWVKEVLWVDIGEYEYKNYLELYDPQLFYGRTATDFEVRVWDDSKQDWYPLNDFYWRVSSNTIYLEKWSYSEALNGRTARVQVKFL